MVLKVLRNGSKCGLQEETASGLLDKWQNDPTQSYLPLISHPRSAFIKLNPKKSQEKRLSLGLPKPRDLLSETSGSSLLPTFSGSQVISLWQPLTELPNNVQQLSCQLCFSHLTSFSCISLRRDNLGKRKSWHIPVSFPVFPAFWIVLS